MTSARLPAVIRANQQQKGQGGVGSHRCVVEDGGMVVLMPSAQVVVMS